MQGHCDKHVFEAREATCNHCGGDYCGDCLVYAHGPKKPPLCVSCALAAAGVRSTAARPVVRSKREIRREVKAQRKTQKLAAKARTATTPEALLHAAPVGSGGSPLVEFEFTINDDGTTNRPGVAASEPSEPEAPTSTGSTSLFDQVEPVDKAS